MNRAASGGHDGRRGSYPAIGGERYDDLQQRPWSGLLYLFFVFLPLAFTPGVDARAWIASVAACLLFLPLYLASFRVSQRTQLEVALLIALIGYALLPFNPGGNTFVIYAMAGVAGVLSPPRTIAVVLLLLAVMAAELLWLVPPRVALSFVGVVAVIGTMVVSGVLYGRIQARRDADLRLSQDEVRRIAAMAERERISRDLHDLLGHTLSLVVLKSELAGRLVERDPAAAGVQIRDVEQVARKALSELREAVSGIRAGSLEAELAAARLALLGADVHLDQRLVGTPLSPAVDATLALALREMITNVLRHAGASRVEVELEPLCDGALQLTVSDDGRGGVLREGNGLTGMRERISSIGATLALDSPPSGGTRVCVHIPHGWAAGKETAA